MQFTKEFILTATFPFPRHSRHRHRRCESSVFRRAGDCFQSLTHPWLLLAAVCKARGSRTDETVTREKTYLVELESKHQKGELRPGHILIQLFRAMAGTQAHPI